MLRLSTRHIALAIVSLALSLMGALALTSSPSASAAIDCGGVSTSIIGGDICAGAVKDSKDSSKNPIVSVLTFVMQILTGAVGIAAVGAIIYGAILYSSAGGDAGQVQRAKTVLKDTVIGIVCYAGMVLILNFIIPGGVFGQNGTTGGGTTASTGGSSDSTSSLRGGNLTVATFNLRSTSLDAWSSARSNAILNYIKTVDIVGIQEGTSTSVGWLKTKLKSAGYSSAAYKTGEYRAIFWKSDKLTVVKQGVKNLPDSRNLVWIRFKLKSTSSEFYFLNTHLKVWGTSPSNWSTTVTSPYRIREIKGILSFIKSSIASDVPTIFVGDMNSYPKSSEDKLIQSGEFQDSFNIAAAKKNQGYSSSSKSIMGTAQKGSRGQVDHIYSKNGITISRAEVMINAKGSDHVPVEAAVTLPGSENSSTGSATGTDSTPATINLSSGIGNFRDAGDSGYIKKGVLYRSASLNEASSSDKTKLATLLKGGVLIDLRLSSDAGYKKDPSLSGVTNKHIAIKGEASAAGYKSTFINNKTMRAQFGKAMTAIADSSGPALIHCKAGKDRTGWLVALIMMSTGVSRDNARSEYLKSPSVNASWFNAAYSEATTKSHTGGSGKIIDFILRSVSSGGLGVSQGTIDKLNSKLGK